MRLRGGVLVVVEAAGGDAELGAGGGREAGELGCAGGCDGGVGEGGVVAVWVVHYGGGLRYGSSGGNVGGGGMGIEERWLGIGIVLVSASRSRWGGVMREMERLF